MAYRDVLVCMNSSATGASCAAFAADLGARYGSHLIGAFARGRIAEPFLPIDVVAWLGVDEVQKILAAHAKVVEQHAQTAQKTFETAAADAQVTSDWQVVEDVDELIGSARRTDLMVLAAEREQLDPYSPASLAISVGGPAIIAPSDCDRAEFRRVLVAWNGGPEVARALHQAWPIVAGATQVDILVVSRRRLGGPEGALQRHFERHGIHPNLIVDESDDAAAGSILQRQIEQLAPDVVVMGLYGRTRLRELVLGGASREILAETKVPLFVHH